MRHVTCCPTRLQNNNILESIFVYFSWFSVLVLSFLLTLQHLKLLIYSFLSIVVKAPCKAFFCHFTFDVRSEADS